MSGFDGWGLSLDALFVLIEKRAHHAESLSDRRAGGARRRRVRRCCSGRELRRVVGREPAGDPDAVGGCGDCEPPAGRLGFWPYEEAHCAEQR